jgi:hypothetical protein
VRHKADAVLVPVLFLPAWNDEKSLCNLYQTFIYTTFSDFPLQLDFFFRHKVQTQNQSSTFTMAEQQKKAVADKAGGNMLWGGRFTG